MPGRKSSRLHAASEVLDSEETKPEHTTSRLSPATLKLLDEMAARGRARRQALEALGPQPWELRKRDPAWQKRWDDLLAQVRAELPPDLTPEEVEAEITRASEEVRNERIARGR